MLYIEFLALWLLAVAGVAGWCRLAGKKDSEDSSVVPCVFGCRRGR